MINWAKDSQFFGFQAGTTGAAATVSGPIIDMDGFESAYGALYVEVTSTGSRLWCKTGTATNAMSDTTGMVEMSQPGGFMNIYRPGKRYLQFMANTTGAGANSVLGTWAYNSRVRPTTNTTAVVGNSYQTPGSGTASA